MEQPVLEFKNVNLRYAYDKLDTLCNLSFCVNCGHLLTLEVGWQEGKTSIAKLVCGMILPTSGEVLYNGAPAHLNLKSSKRAVIFDNFALQKNKSVRKNIEFGMKLRRVEKDKRLEYLTDCGKAFGLTDVFEKKVKSLSSLDKLKTALARAYWREVDLAVFDDVLERIPDDDREAGREAIDIFMKKHACAALFLVSKQTVNTDDV